jgi:hypothetical protein
LYEIALKDFYLENNPRKTVALLRFVADHVPGEYYGAWIANVRYTLAGALRSSGDPIGGLEQYARVYLLHFESPMLRLSATMGISRSLFDAGRFDDALRWLESEEVDGSAVGEEILYRRGVCYFRLCKAEKAHEILVQLAQGAPRHVWVEKAQGFLNDIKNGKEVSPSCPRTGH